MELQLSRIFQTANHWEALILLDEVDVYLEQRSTHDVARNKLVTVFLRKIEYCEGIMFLTTNRVSDFDEAILSRIYLKVKYDELDLESRDRIWRHFLLRARTSHGAAVVAHAEVKRLAKTVLNGRQVGSHWTRCGNYFTDGKFDRSRTSSPQLTLWPPRRILRWLIRTSCERLRRVRILSGNSMASRWLRAYTVDGQG